MILEQNNDVLSFQAVDLTPTLTARAEHGPSIFSSRLSLSGSNHDEIELAAISPDKQPFERSPTATSITPILPRQRRSASQRTRARVQFAVLCWSLFITGWNDGFVKYGSYFRRLADGTVKIDGTTVASNSKCLRCS